MRRVVANVVLLSLVLNCTYSVRQYHTYDRGGIIRINDSLGEVIDAEERLEYDLFKGIEGFKEARFFAIGGGGYETEIVADHGTYITTNRDPRAIRLLEDYLSQYNTMQYGQRDFEKKWKIIGYDMLGFPITQHDVDKHSGHGCCIASSVGLGLVTFALSAFVAWGYGIDRASDPDQSAVNARCLMIVLGGTTSGLAVGHLVGRRMDRDKAIDVIREARMPRRVRSSHTE